MVSYLTTLFLGKPPGGSLQVLSVHSFADLEIMVLNLFFYYCVFVVIFVLEAWGWVQQK